MISSFLKPAVIINDKKFKILNKIGQGGIGFIYRVLCVANNKHYALKKMICQSDVQLQEAINEIQLMELLNSEYVLPLLDNYTLMNKNKQNEVHDIIIMNYKLPNYFFDFCLGVFVASIV
jgi:serine/threonine kinase 16